MSEHAPIPDRVNAIAKDVVDAAIKVHAALGPGLLESVYTACLAQELAARGHSVRGEVPLPVVYEDTKLDVGFRIDLLIDELVIIEVKAVDALHPVFEAQVLTYLRFSGKRLGLLLNFNVVLMKQGIRRLVL
jgi:GxxExxY protein